MNIQHLRVKSFSVLLLVIAPFNDCLSDISLIYIFWLMGRCIFMCVTIVILQNCDGHRKKMDSADNCERPFIN